MGVLSRVFQAQFAVPLEQLFWIGFLLTEIFKKSKGLSLKFLGAFYKTITQKRARDLFLWCFLFFSAKNKVSFSCFSKTKAKKRRELFLFWWTIPWAQSHFFKILRIFSTNFKGSEQGCPWPFRPFTWSVYSFYHNLT